MTDDEITEKFTNLEYLFNTEINQLKNQIDDLKYEISDLRRETRSLSSESSDLLNKIHQVERTADEALLGIGKLNDFI